MANKYRVAVIAGDGIGKEVVPEGIAAMEAAARRYGFSFEWREFDWSCETYAKTGRMMHCGRWSHTDETTPADVASQSGHGMFAAPATAQRARRR